MPRLVVAAVLVEGRTKSEVARDYRVSRRWVQVLVAWFLAEGDAELQPRHRRPAPHWGATGRTYSTRRSGRRCRAGIERARRQALPSETLTTSRAPVAGSSPPPSDGRVGFTPGVVIPARFDLLSTDR